MPSLDDAMKDGAKAKIAAARVKKAADASPRSGSVTQSSNVGVSNVTIDRVTASARRGAQGPIFSISNGTKWSIKTEDAQLRRPLGVPDPDMQGAQLSKRVDNGTLIVRAYTDIEAPTTDGNGNSVPDADYLAGGTWLYVPDDALQTSAFQFGAFIDGNDAFSGTIGDLSGTANYEGKVIGVYSEEGDDDAFDVGYFDADLNMSASFDATSEAPLGTVSGEVYDFTIDGQKRAGRMALGAARIEATNHGFFQGDVSMTQGGVQYQGKWGGHFFGNGRQDGKPDAVAGTFGGRSTSGSDISFVGVFGADTRKSPLPSQ